MPNVNEQKTVCVQGLGYVGLPVAVAIASALRGDGSPVFRVIGVDLPTEGGRAIIDAVNDGRMPFHTSDESLVTALAGARERGNLSATDDPEAFQRADVVMVDIPLDLVEDEMGPSADFESFRKGIRIVGEKVSSNTLVIVETTTPPGTCERIVLPELVEAFIARGLSEQDVMLAHSFERVMPGKNYLESITNYWRVYAANTDRAADACKKFLSDFINTKDYPLTRVSSLTTSETVKIMENSYRAATIAFADEWGRFCESVGVDAFEIIDAIRVRPTHSNIRTPGLGVGGYCLTKDPAFAEISARRIFNFAGLEFPMSGGALKINREMPMATVRKVRELIGSFEGKKILLCGVTYRPDVDDTRESPSQIFFEAASAEGAEFICHDPMTSSWPETNAPIQDVFPAFHGFDAVVFAVPHQMYREMDFRKMLNGSKPVIFDANNVLTTEQGQQIRNAGALFSSIGRGEGAA